MNHGEATSGQSAPTDAFDLETDTSADASTAFGPVASRTFYIKPGITVERAGQDRNCNHEWLFSAGPGIASARSSA